MPTTTPSVNVSLITLDGTDPTKTSWGARLTDQKFFVLANGTSADETFDAADIPSATATLMATNGRGLSVDMGAGNDTVIGSAYGDNITGGAGTNYIDGGANGGTQPDGSKAYDVLDVYVADSAAASAVVVVALDNTATGADAAAFAGGYLYKVTNGGTETNYVKNVEQIVLRLASDRSFISAIDLSVIVREVASSVDPATQMHLAWAEGGNLGGSFNAATDVSTATQNLMTTHGRGVFVHMGSGNDTVTGSAFGDNIDVGAGVNYIDGGANGGSPPWGGKAEDVLQMTVASQAASDALQVTSLSGTGSAADITAFGNGYAYKIVDATGGQTNYVKGIERVSVQIQSGGTTTFGRDIALAIVAREVNLSDTNLANYHQVAWINGTDGADTIDVSGNTALLSTALKSNMTTSQRGVWINGGNGNDTITGTGYADTIRNGSGDARVDGGDNAHAAGRMGDDIFEIEVASEAAMNAVVVSASDDPNYTWMVTYGSGSTQKDYLKNIEAISVYVTGGTGKWIALAPRINEVSASTDISNYAHLAWVNGTDQGDTFSVATDISADTQARMATNTRGVYVNLGAGNDTVTGSAYGDHIDVGSGTNYVDAGLNGGTMPWGGKAEDVLQMTVASQAASDALQVLTLSASGGSATDIAAFNSGYTHKVFDTVGNQVNYVKGIERVSVSIGNGTTQSFGRNIALDISVQEVNLSDTNLANYYTLAWVNGTGGADTIDLSGDTALLSAALKTNMASTKRGVWVDGGAGNDVITGTAAADSFVNGAGDSRIDGGTNISTGGRLGQDVFQIEVANTAAMNAIVIAASDDPNYTWMVTYGSGSSQKDYLKNIEAVSVNVTGGGVGKWGPLALSINEVASGTDLTNMMHLAWVNGTDLADTFNATTDISSATQTLMTTNGRGVYVNTGAGNDTVTGSAYGDHIDVGSGTNYVDGGANGGATPWGGKAEDSLQMTVASRAASDALQVVSLSASGGSATDTAAFNNGYTHKLLDTVGNQVNYIKGIERVSVSIYDGTTHSFGRNIALDISVQEVNLSDANLANYSTLAWVNGTDGADTIDLGGDTALLSTALKANMASTKRGVWVDGGAGNDVITGTAAVDNFVNGAGDSKIDGGTNVRAGGQSGQDIFQIEVASTAAMNAVTISASDDPNYTWMVTYGSGSSQKDYLKNIEAVVIAVTGGGASKWTPLALNINEVAAGADITNQMHLAWVNGTDLADTFNAATDISSATQALMATNARGVYVNTGAGNDTVTGTAYGDNVDVGSGTNYVDGGANGGTLPWGGKAEDVLQMTVQSKAASDALQVVTLTASGGSTADNTAFSNGFTHKVLDAIGNQVNYVKGIERISVNIYDGTTYSFGRNIALEVSVQEANLSDANIASYSQLAWVRGTEGGETIDLSGDTALLTSALKTNMASTHRGVWVDGGAGDDVITGTSASDSFVNGAGNAKIDGGAHLSTGGRIGQDMFQIEVASAAAMNAVVISVSDDANYSWMVTYGSGSVQKDYLKNIEGVIIMVAGGGAGKYVPLSMTISEVSAGTDISHMPYLATVTGTEAADTFNTATDISAATLALMATNGRGVNVNMGAGNDTVTGSAYGDLIVAGTGTNYVDGGANGGPLTGPSRREDTLLVETASQAACNAVQVLELTASGGSATDVAAFANGYTFKVIDSIGNQINYVKGIERVDVVVRDGTTTGLGRGFQLAVLIHEFNLSDANSENYTTIASVTGTDFADVIDMSGDTALLSSAIKTNMASTNRGVMFSAGGGNDVITGTAAADYIINGGGNAKIDGGANTSADGRVGSDVFHVTVATADEVSAVVVSPSDDTNYTWMVTYGNGSTQKDYLKNIESVVVASSTSGVNWRWIRLAMVVNESSAATAAAGATQLVHVNGTDQGETFNAATHVSGTTRALMTTYQAGVSTDLGGGNDTVIGSAYGDTIDVGTGTNYVDGGANLGNITPWGTKPEDVLQMQLASKEAYDALQVTHLDGASASATDNTAFANGYTEKVHDVVGGAVNYIKGIESIWVNYPVRGASESGYIGLLTRVQEVNLSDTNSANSSYVAFISGTIDNDTIDLSGDSALLSSAIKENIAATKRGVMVYGSAGSDIIIGTDGADTFTNGTGNSKIDGGANSARPSGVVYDDRFDIDLSNATEANAVVVSASDDPNYQWMVTYGGASIQKDYLKNIEAVHVFGGGTYRYIPLPLRVAPPAGPDEYVATVNGTTGNFNATTDLSAANQALVDGAHRGIRIVMGNGDDKVVGTAYGDEFDVGLGVNYIDGGANGGTSLNGNPALDVLQMKASSTNALNWMTLTVLTASGGSATDQTAFSNGYTHKIHDSVAQETNYMKGIEKIVISPIGGADFTTPREIFLTVTVSEVNLAAFVDWTKPLATISGGALAETIDASSGAGLLSTALRSAMDTHQMGIAIDGGAANDTITGTVQNDVIAGGAGNDIIDGGAGSGDIANYFVPEATGTYSYSLRADGTPVIKLGDVELFTYVRQADGSVIVKGLPGTVAESAGTDVLRNIEAITLSVQVSTYVSKAITVPVGALAWHLGVSGGVYTGSVWDDVLDASVEFPTVVNTATAPYDAHRISFAPGLGNDTMVGTPSSDEFEASSGNDTIDGGGSLFDTLIVKLNATGGQLSTQLESNGTISVKRDATTIFTIADNADGSFLVTGAVGTEGAIYGTELLRNLESIEFNRDTYSPDFGLGNSDTVTVGLAPRSYLYAYGKAGLVANWLGSFGNDTVNLATNFPTVTGGNGVVAKPDLGNDSITGTAGSDLVYASGGIDIIDGAAGTDTLLIDLRDIARNGEFARTTAANGDLQLTMGGVVLVSMQTTADGAILVTGSGAAASIGTELVRNVETIQVKYKADYAGGATGVAAIDLISGAMTYQAGSGNDILTGTANNDTFWNSTGTDKIDGGQGMDTFVVDMMYPYGQTITTSTAANGDRLVMRNGALFFTVHRQDDGDLLVTNSGNVSGSHLGTTVLHNVETLNVEYYTGSITQVISIDLVGIQQIAI